MVWSFYEATTGLFGPQRVSCDPGPTLEKNTPAGYVAIEGRFDPLSQRVNLITGLVEPYVPPKPADTEDTTYIWNEEKKRWVAKSTLTMNKKARKAEVKAAQDAYAATQHHYVRAVVLALAKGNTAATPQQNLQDIHDRIKALDDVIDAINACTTQEQLDAIPPVALPASP